MPLSGNELTRNLSENIRPQSSQLDESLWTDPGIKSGISVRELISSLKKKKKKTGEEWMVEHSPKVLASEGKTTTTTTSSRKHLPLKRLASHWENHEWQWYVIQNGSSTQADYRKYLSPEILSIPYKWFAPQTPLKKIRKIRKKFQAKAIQGHVPWLNLKKNFQISFSQYANNVGTTLFRSMRQAQNTDTHALNQLGVFQNNSPLWSNFTADKHIWHPPRAWM